MTETRIVKTDMIMISKKKLSQQQQIFFFLGTLEGIALTIGTYFLIMGIH